MSLKALIETDLKNALLGGERFKADTLRNLKAAILNEEVAQNKRDEGLADEEVEKVVAREVKKRSESVKLYTEAGRQELADTEAEEISVIEVYLPKQLSEEEIKKAVDEAIAILGVSGPQAMGQVIGSVKARLGNTADGAVVARLVKEALNS
jgi:uncharacterized protein YqeY